MTCVPTSRKIQKQIDKLRTQVKENERLLRQTAIRVEDMYAEKVALRAIPGRN